MRNHGRRQEKPSVPRDGTEIIDSELADQIDRLIERVQSVPWVDVPAVSATSAKTFNRKLIESRKELLARPRLVADGGQSFTDEELGEMGRIANGLIHPALERLTAEDSFDPAGAAVLLHQAVEDLAKLSDAHEWEEEGSFSLNKDVIDTERPI